MAGTPDASSLPLALAALGTTPTRQPQREPPSRKSQPIYLDHSPNIQNPYPLNAQTPPPQRAKRTNNINFGTAEIARMTSEIIPRTAIPSTPEQSMQQVNTPSESPQGRISNPFAPADHITQSRSQPTEHDLRGKLLKHNTDDDPNLDPNLGRSPIHSQIPHAGQFYGEG